ncbi:hypothetical protein ALC56_09851, partial [Trachymyrmex septentrionalis]
FSGRFLNFYSNHPIAQKRGTIFSLIDRAFLLSDFRFHTHNLTFIINILLDNDYSLTFIFDIINQRIKNLIKNRHTTHSRLTDKVETSESVSWLTVPFIPLHTEKFKRFNKNDIRVSFMLNIRKQKNGLNLQTDTNGLHKAYIPIINKV